MAAWTLKARLAEEKPVNKYKFRSLSELPNKGKLSGVSVDEVPLRASNLRLYSLFVRRSSSVGALTIGNLVRIMLS